jgi:hypothetical protein
MPEATLADPGQQEADLAVPKRVADEKLEAVASKVPADGAAPQFPEKFQKGIAISIFQNSGGINSNWGHFAESRGKLCGLIPNIMDRSSPNDGACGFWDRCGGGISLSWRFTFGQFFRYGCFVANIQGVASPHSQRRHCAICKIQTSVAPESQL